MSVELWKSANVQTSVKIDFESPERRRGESVIIEVSSW